MNDNVVDVLLRARLDAGDVTSGVGGIQKALNGLTLPKGISVDLEKSFNKLSPLLKDYQKQLNKGFSSQKDIKNFNLLKEKIDSIFGEIKSKIQEVNGQEIRLKVDTQQIDNLQNKIVKLQGDLQTALQKVFKSGQSSGSIETGMKQLEGAIPKNWTNVASMLGGAKGLFKAGDYAAFNRQLSETLNYINQLKGSSQIDLAHKLGMKEAKTDLKSAQTYLNNFFKSLQTNINEANNIERLRKNLADVGEELEDLQFDAAQRGIEGFNDASSGIDTLINGFNQLHNSTEESASSMVRMVDEVNQLKTSTQYFFSLRNMINLLKRGIDDAVQSVKDLDKAMTETAVVTDFSIADMWKDLPKYTQLANELGATTQGAYETMTLYYQQGLNQQQAFDLGAETMKMARIAGLDYAEATDMMTAALRGFNMELDETSAKRVNDVYSELAAITASDTEELGTAMQRTASIAHSAGASFEGTTAFLAQAIETTREPAENIGTAMKTIIARFQEMKKNPLEIGEVEGEEVDYNKIDAALKTIGVDLKDTNGQFRDFDKVMLDISAKWDTLSQSQQRYIATTAAGSRQQSRFIAMVSNYERTMQLMEAANNSTGASEEQFGKTMDSLEAKLNQLHNAWQAFTMGIANNSMIKIAVDGLTAFLTTTNKIIDTLSGGIGPIKSFLSIFTAFTGLKMGGKVINSLIGGLGGMVDPQKTFKEGLKTGFFGSGKDQLQADRISNPIVNAINGLIPHIDNTVKANNEQNAFAYNERGSYNAARKNLNSLLWEDKGIKESGKYRLSNIRTILNDNQLTKEQEKAFFSSSPGLTKNIAKNLGVALEKAGAKPEVASGLAKGFQQGNFSLDEVLLKGGLGITAEEHYNRLNEKDPAQANAFRADLIHKGKEKGLKGDQLGEYIKNTVIPTEAGEEFLNKMQQLTPGEKIAEGLGKAGAAMTSFGASLQTVGANLSTVNPQLGQFVSGLGSMLTTAGSAVSALSNLANPLVLAGAAIGVAIYADQKRLQGVKDAADKVTESYKNIYDQTTENINNLKSYQSEFAILAKGVDKNGNNVSLDTTQYDRYVEMVDEIAQLNPAIVEGYNAQGHAIISNNEALNKTIELQKKLQDEATSKYLEDDSLDKLIAARDINSGYIDSLVDRKTKGQVQKTFGEVNEETISKFTNKEPVALSSQAMAIGSQIEKSDLYINNKKVVEDILGQYDITLEQLANGEQKAVDVFKTHAADIKSQLVTAAGIKDVEFSDNFDRAFEQWDTSLTNFNESIEDIYKNLSTSISSSGLYEEIDANLRPAFQEGLKEIAATGKSAKDMKADAATLATEFANLTDSSSNYSEALKQVEKYQDAFADNLDVDAYNEAINADGGPIALLEQQLKTIEGRTDAVAQAEREFLENEIDSIKKFTESSFGDLSSALNTAIDDIAAAEGALDSFNEATKTDYDTAAEGFSTIYDKIFETYKDSLGNEREKHTEGEGDNTFWTGAQALLSDKALGGGVNEVSKRIKELEPMLREGQEGVEHFYDAVVNNEGIKELRDQGLIKLDEDGWFAEIPEEQYKNVADALGISEELLTSMLNKARQFDLISFSNLDQVRKTLSTSNEAIQGIGSDKNGKQALYVKEDTMRAQLFDAGYHTKESQDTVIKDMAEQQNINMVKTMDNLTVDMAKGLTKAWGVKDLPDLIQKMNETGEYNKEEILDLATKSGLADGLDASQIYDDVVQAMDNPEIAKQTSELVDINAKLSTLIDKNDGTTYKDHEDVQKEAHEEVFGKDGEVDSTADYFARGTDVEGNLLDAGTFNNLRNLYTETAAEWEKSAKEYEARSKIGTKAEQEHYAALAKKYKDDAANLRAYIKDGEEAWEQGSESLEKQRRENEAKNKSYTKGQSTEERSTKLQKKRSKRTVEEDQKRGKQLGDTIIQRQQTAKTNVKKENEKHEQRNETVTFKAKEDPSYKKLKKEHDEIEPEQDVNTTFTAEDGGLVDAKDNAEDIKQFSGDVVSMTVDAAYATVDSATESIGKAQDAASQGIQIDSTANTTPIETARQKALQAAGRYVINVVGSSTGLGGILSTLGSILRKKQEINNTPVKGGGGATGRNNYISHQSIPSFGSAARGHGTVGPKNKGGLTLTGEKGFEIAWIPSENRSMILGASGPQMVNLPSDAVIWTNEQSKKILKQKAIPAGSHGAEVTGKKKKLQFEYVKETKNPTPSLSPPKPADPKPSGKPKSSKDTKDEKQTVGTSKKVFDWWKKIEHRVDAASRKSDTLDKKLTKILADVRATTSDVKKANKEYIKAQKSSIKINQSIVDIANKKLKKLEKGDSKKQSKKVKKAEKALKKAEKNNDKKAIKKAKKNLNKAQKGYNWQTVKWQQTKKGKKVDKSSKVDLSKFIKQDANGAYYVDKKAINAKTKDSKAKRKAIQEKAYELIDKWNDRKNDANDKVTEAQDNLADYRKQIDDNFFGWINELTKVYRLTGEIEKIEARMAKQRSKFNLAQTKLDQLDIGKGLLHKSNAGLKSILQEAKQANEQILKEYDAEIKKKKELKEANNAEIDSMGRLTDNKIKYIDINGKTQTATEKERFNQIKKISKENGSGTSWDELSESDKRLYARGIAFNKSFIKGDKNSGFTIDEQAIEKARKNGELSEELASLIKDVYDGLHEHELETLNIETEILDLESERLETSKDYQNIIDDISAQLFDWTNELTKIKELTLKIEQGEKRISYLKASQEYYNAKQAANYGDYSVNYLKSLIGELATTVKTISERPALLSKQRQDLLDIIAGADLDKTITYLKNQRSTNPELYDAAIKARTEEKEIRDLARNYIKSTINADGTVTISIDSDAIERDRGTKITQENYPKLEEYLQTISEKSDEIQELVNTQVQALTELYRQLSDLKQQYSDRAKELRDAYNNQQQKIIDNLKTLYTTIDNNIKDLLNLVKQDLADRRKREDNAKTETDIAKKQQRLAVLRADTSGGNQVAIAQLEKEIADAQQSYGRTLEDQLLDKLSTQNDLAAKQREQQISLLQSQRDIAAKTGQDAATINAWLANVALNKDKIQEVLMSDATWDALTTAEQEALAGEINVKIGELETLPGAITTIEAAINSLGTEIKAVDTEVKNTIESSYLKTNSSFKNSLTDAVIDLSTKEDVDTQTNTLINAFEDITNKDLATNKKIKNVEALINSIGGISLSSNPKIVAAEQALASLTNEQKSLLSETTLKKLSNARSSYNKMVADKQAADNVASLIKNIGNVKLDNASFNKIEKAKEALNKLTKDQLPFLSKELITIYEEAIQTYHNLAREYDEQRAIEQRKLAAEQAAQEERERQQRIAEEKARLAAEQAAREEEQRRIAQQTSAEIKDAQKWYESNKNISSKSGALISTGTMGGLTKAQDYYQELALRGSKNNTGYQYWNQLGPDGLKKLIKWGGTFGLSTKQVLDDLAKTESFSWDEIIKAFVRMQDKNGKETKKAKEAAAEALKGLWGTKPSDGKQSGWKKYFGKEYPKYKRGGLASSTGPAWLDGTPSKPELVLNAQDTKNFIALKDVLSKAMNSAGSIENNYGNATYEININVDHLNNDYDVDKVVERVKKKIVQDSSYRNVTQVRKFR